MLFSGFKSIFFISSGSVKQVVLLSFSLFFVNNLVRHIAYHMIKDKKAKEEKSFKKTKK
jgi:hypothetical protein